MQRPETAAEFAVFDKRQSINEVGWRFQPCGFNNLEMVAQICPGWNPLTRWLEQIEHFRKAA